MKKTLVALLLVASLFAFVSCKDVKYTDEIASLNGVVYSSLQKAIDDAADGDTVKLLCNATGKGAEIGSSITLDFGGHTYTFNDNVEIGTKLADNENETGFRVKSGTTVVLQNAKLEAVEGFSAPFISSEGTLKLEETTIAPLVGQVALDIYSGSVTVDEESSVSGVVNISNDNSSKITFAKAPEDIAFTGNLTETIYYGAEVQTEITAATVVMGNKGYETIEAAIDNSTEGQTIVLLSNKLGNIVIPEAKDITIDLGGNTITSEMMNGTAGILNLGKVTLKNGTFTHSEESANFYLIQNHGTMVLENMDIIGYAKSASMVINGKDADGVAEDQKTGNLTINNCSLEQNGPFVAIKNELGTCVVNNSNLSRENTHNVINAWDNMTLNNCEVTGGIMFGNWLGESTTLTINGGTYDCVFIHEYMGDAKLVVSDADFTNSEMTAVFGGSLSSEGTLHIEMTNTTIAADLSQWLPTSD